MKEPSQGGFIGSLDVYPVQLPTVFGTGKRHIEETQVFRQLFTLCMDPVLSPAPRSQVEDRLVSIIRIVKHI